MDQSLLGFLTLQIGLPAQAWWCVCGGGQGLELPLLGWLSSDFRELLAGPFGHISKTTFPS